MAPLDRPICSACGSPVKPFKYGLWRCISCGTGRVWPRDSGTGTGKEIYRADYFNSKNEAKGYFDADRVRKWKRHTASLLIKRIQKHLNEFPRPVNVLDFGAGMGDFSMEAQSRGMNVVALEPNPAGRALMGLQPDKIVASLSEVKEDLDFDLIVLNDVIEHLEDPVAELAVLVKRLSSRGIIVITTPDFRGPFRRLLGSRWPHLKPEEHLHYFTREGLRTLFESSGLVCAETAAHFKFIGIDYLFNDQGRRGGRIGFFSKIFAKLLKFLIPFPVPAYLDEIMAVGFLSENVERSTKRI